MAEFDLSALDDVINRLSDLESEGPDALADTLNYGADLLIDASVDAITSELNLDASYVESKISKSQLATPSRFTATIRAARRGLLMPRYETQQLYSGGKRSGVSVKIKKKEPAKKMKSAFFIKLKKGTQSGAGAMAVAYRPKDGKALNPKHQAAIDTYGYAVMHSASVSQALETLSEAGQIHLDNELLINYFLNRIQK